MNYLNYNLSNYTYINTYLTSGPNTFGFLQVMYDASGVRLHAGRQAEVISLFASEYM